MIYDLNVNAMRSPPGLVCLTVLIITFLLFPAQGQKNTFTKAESHYSGGEYRKALYYLKKYVRTDSTHAEAFKMLGNCYYEVNQLDSALTSYLRAVDIDSLYADAYFNIANVKGMRNQWKEAAYYYRIFTRLEPEDVEGWNSLALIMQKEEKIDSAIIYLEKTRNLDPENLFALYNLSLNHFYLRNFGQSLKYASQGIEIDSMEKSYYLITGLSYFYRMEFENALAEFDKALRVYPKDINLLAERSKAVILNNTDREMVKLQNDLNFTFTTIHSNNIAQLDKWLESGSDKYDYEELKTKFNETPESMGLDEYFMFYYGQHKQNNYAPYSMDRSPFDSLAQNDDYKTIITLADRINSRNPFDLNDYFYLALAHYEEGNFDKFMDNFQKYHNLMMSISATGDGKSPETAFIVLSTTHEYYLINYLGFTMTSQSLIFENDQSYDKLDCIDEYGNKQSFYFNIQKPFSTLGLLGGKEKKNKTKSKKK